MNTQVNTLNTNNNTNNFSNDPISILNLGQSGNTGDSASIAALLLQLEELLGIQGTPSKNKNKNIQTDDITTTPPPGSNNNTSGSNNKQNLVALLVEMAQALGVLEALLGKYRMDRSKFEFQIGKINLKVAQENITATIKNIQKMNQKEKTARTWKIVVEVLSYVAAAAMIIIGALTAQPELVLAGVLMLGFAIANTDFTGNGSAMDKLTGPDGALTKALMKDGLSQKDAQLVAALIVVVVLIVLTLGAGAAAGAVGAAGEEGAEVGVEEGVDIGTEEGVDAAGESGDSVFEMTSSSKFQKIFGPLIRFLRAHPNLSRTLFVGSQSAAQTGLITDLSQIIATAAAHGNKKEEQKWMIAMEVILLALVVVLSLGGGAGMMGDAGSVSADASSAAFTGTKFGQALLEIAYAAETLAQMGQGVADIVLGNILLEEAKILLALAASQAGQKLSDTNLDMLDVVRKKDSGDTTKEIEDEAKSLASLESVVAKDLEAVVQILEKAV